MIIFNNVLFLGKSKHLFHDIATELRKDGKKCYEFAFELGDYVFTKIHKDVIFVPNRITNNKYNISDHELINLGISDLAYYSSKDKKYPKKLLDFYKRYMYFIDGFLKEKKIELIYAWNGNTWQEKLVSYLAKEQGIFMVYFELGYFRPYTLTCDYSGVNYFSSIPRNREFYEEVEVDQIKLEKYLFKPEDDVFLTYKKDSYFKTAISKILTEIGILFKLHPRYYKNRNLKYYIKKYIGRVLLKYRKAEHVELPDNYIFIPLQVNSDTQVLLHSKTISNMEELIEFSIENIEKLNQLYNKNFSIVIKIHPEEIGTANYDRIIKKYKENNNIIFLYKFDINKLIKNCHLVITLNSTVGIEALCMYKRVITLGEAFYNIDGIVRTCEDINDLYNTIYKCLNEEENKELISKFLYFLRFRYQVEGFIYNSNIKTTLNIIERVNKYAKYAKHPDYNVGNSKQHSAV